jgi:hypothetical protein
MYITLSLLIASSNDVNRKSNGMTDTKKNASDGIEQHPTAIINDRKCYGDPLAQFITYL